MKLPPLGRICVGKHEAGDGGKSARANEAAGGIPVASESRASSLDSREPPLDHEEAASRKSGVPRRMHNGRLLRALRGKLTGRERHQAAAESHRISCKGTSFCT